jgi:hypothetical protein
MLYYASSHLMLTGIVLSGAVVLLLITHLGQLGRFSALFRRRCRRNKP